MELAKLINLKVKGKEDSAYGDEEYSPEDENAFEEVTSQVLAPDSAFSPFELISRTLHQLAREGNHVLLALALERLGDQRERRINKLDEDGLAPLHYAARYSHADTVRTLLQKKAQVNIKGADGLTPLHFAARYRRSLKKKRKAKLSKGELVSPTDLASFLDLQNKNNLKVIQNEGIQEEAEAGEENVFDLDEELEKEIEDAQNEEEEEEEEEENEEAQDNEELTENEEDPKIPLQTQLKPEEVNSPTSLSLYEDELENESVVRILVENGAHVNARDVYGLTPLHFASMRGNDVAARDLLTFPHVDIEARDKQLMTPLIIAATYGYIDICKRLIMSGAELNAYDESFQTPLHNSAAEGHLDIVELLLTSAKEHVGLLERLLSSRDAERQTPLHVAVASGHKDCSQLLLERGAEVNSKRDTLATALHLAAIGGDVEILKLLLEYGAKIDAVDVNQQTALHKASFSDQIEAIYFLLDRGAKIERKDRDSFTPLLLASSSGHAEAIQALLNRGASVEAVDKDDKTAVFWCSEQGHEKALKVLLEDPLCREQVDVSDRYDNSPLHEAARRGYVRVLRALLDAGSLIDNKNEDEETALHIAAEEGHSNVVKELIKRYRFLINDENEDANTPLHLASLQGRERVVELLLQAGADVEARNTSLWTPLDCASAKGNVNVCKLLIDFDSPLDPIDKTKTTPLQLAAKEGHVDVTNLLLEKGASLAVCDASGRNALEIALSAGRRDVALAIIRSKHWLSAMRNIRKDPQRNGRRITPFRMLIRKFPDVAEAVLDRCTSTNGKDSEDPEFGIKFDYEFIDDTYHSENTGEVETEYLMSTDSDANLSSYDDEGRLFDWAKPYSDDAQQRKNNHPLMLMVKHRRSGLLGHPVSVSLVKHKWQSFGRKLYYFNLVFYSIFVVFLTGYVVTAIDRKYAENILYANKTDMGSSLASVKDPTCQELQKDLGLEESFLVQVGKWIVVSTSILNIIREIFQFSQARLNYLGVENLLEWICYIFALLLVGERNWFYRDEEPCFIRENWQWQLGAISIFLAWLNLVLFIRKFPYFGIYVVMFTDIFYTFTKFFIVFFLFIVGFGLSFFMLLRNQLPFEFVGKSMLKTTVMMIGEFEYDSIFNTGDADSVPYETVSYIIFIIFLILMPILVMNLLVGLAVDDIKAVQDEAVLKRLAMQTELVMGVEVMIPERLRRHFSHLYKIIYPNRKTISCSRIFKDFRLLETFDYSAVDDSRSPNLLMENRIAHLSRQVEELRLENMKIHTLLTTLVTFSQRKDHTPGDLTPSTEYLAP